MIEYLILDYNRPVEARALLESIKRYSQFDYSVTYLCNGGEPKHARKLRQRHLIDNLIINPHNVGCGAGTIQLFAHCQTEYAFYVQVDHVLTRPITPPVVDEFITFLKSGRVACLDLAGNQGNPRFSYSERAQFINVAFYNSIPKSIGGPGPWCHIPWTERCVLDFFTHNHLSVGAPLPGIAVYTPEGPIFPPPYFRDSGKWSLRSNPDGSQWKQKSDTKQLWMLKAPSVKFEWPVFTDAEWKEVIATQSWAPGKIPEKMQEFSFEVPDGYWGMDNL